MSDQAILDAIAGQETRWRGYDWKLIPAVALPAYLKAL